MSETDPGHIEQHAGDIGARRATVGLPTDHESINVPPTRPGAAENARRAAEAREGNETFIPEPPVPDERAEAAAHQQGEEQSVPGQGGRTHHGSSPARSGTAHHESAPVGDGARYRSSYTGPGVRYQSARELRMEIEETRRELADTVSALAAKADVKARAGQAAGAAKDRALGMVGSFRGKTSQIKGQVAGKVREGGSGAPSGRPKMPMLLMAAGGAAAAVGLGGLMRDRRRMYR